MDKPPISPAAFRRPADGQTWTDLMARTGAWGLSAQIDLYGCGPEAIRSGSYIKEFVVALCDKIGMRRHGPCHLENFGEDARVAGYSMLQLIETSCVSAHFANESNAVYLDIFSCKAYEPDEAAEFAKEWFGAASVTLTSTLRM